MFRSSFSGFCKVLTKRFRWCNCVKHASVMDVNWVKNRFYTKELAKAKAILAAVRPSHCVSHQGTNKGTRFQRNSCTEGSQVVLSPNSAQFERGTGTEPFFRFSNVGFRKFCMVCFIFETCMKQTTFLHVLYFNQIPMETNKWQLM